MNDNTKFNLCMVMLISALLSIAYVSESGKRKADALQVKIDEQVKANASLREAAVLATRLQTHQVWYVVGNGSKVTSEPDSRGVVVNLDTPLLPMGNHEKILRPDQNRRISFYPATVGYNYTVAGGLLEYAYYSN